MFHLKYDFLEGFMPGMMLRHQVARYQYCTGSRTAIAYYLYIFIYNHIFAYIVIDGVCDTKAHIGHKKFM